MIITRRFGVTGSGRPVEEVTQWIPVSETDPRGMDVPGYEGRWIVAGISNSLGVHGAEPVGRGEFDTALEVEQARQRGLAEQVAEQARQRARQDRQELVSKGVPQELITRLVGPEPVGEQGDTRS